MKGNKSYQRRIVALVGLVWGLTLPAAMASAQAQTEILQVRSKVANAQFVSYDPTGCVATVVFVTAADLAQNNPPGGPEEFRRASVSLIKLDLCTNTVFHNAHGISSSFDFRVSGTLGAATLVVNHLAMFEVTNPTSVPDFYVDVNVAWNGIGDVDRGNQRFFVAAPGMVVDIFQTGFSRLAQATGTIFDGATNFIPEPSGFGKIDDLLFGRITITRSP